VSIALNAVLMTAQVLVGIIAHSQALIADGIHSLADLVSDFVVLVANRRGAAAPDVDHNYGHSRYETVASLFLGGLLIAVGVGMLWRAGERIANLQDIPPVHSTALIVALVVLASKEALFRYMLRAAERVRSAMLIANAWHARSDAASSLVVALGIIGNMAGFQVLDPIAAAIVGFMVARMGWIFGWDALQDLSDRALDQATADDLRALVLSTPGVREVHELRTRKMGDLAIVDAHILVDALIHVDPENDEVNPPPGQLPMRPVVAEAVRAALGAQGLSFDAMNLHYLSRGFDVDLLLPALASAEESAQADERLAKVDFEALRRRLGAREIRVARAVRSPGGSIQAARGAKETAAPR
jgi:cation diffusion facilitator family transporter